MPHLTEHVKLGTANRQCHRQEPSHLRTQATRKRKTKIRREKDRQAQRHSAICMRVQEAERSKKPTEWLKKQLNSESDPISAEEGWYNSGTGNKGDQLSLSLHTQTHKAQKGTFSLESGTEWKWSQLFCDLFGLWRCIRWEKETTVTPASFSAGTGLVSHTKDHSANEEVKHRITHASANGRLAGTK